MQYETWLKAQRPVIGCSTTKFFFKEISIILTDVIQVFGIILRREKSIFCLNSIKGLRFLLKKQDVLYEVGTEVSNVNSIYSKLQRLNTEKRFPGVNRSAATCVVEYDCRQVLNIDTDVTKNIKF